ncbi:MAG TPA: lactonase family protein [Acidobacteriaceae bacterium]|nr:lactonase family protein [Acidobacteriaceae bacterium]
MLTRRRFLLTLPAAAATAAAEAQSFSARFRRTPPPPPLPTFVYFGTDTEKGASRGIYRARFDEATGHVSAPELAAATARPSFLAISQPMGGRRRLYAVNAVANPSATVTSFAMNPQTGALTEINQVSSDGAGPCYISLDALGEAAFVANYVGSSIATYRVLPDGALSDPVEHFDYKDPRFGKRGPNTARQDIPHPHSVHLSPDNRFLLVSDLGSDTISIFPVDAAHGRVGEPVLFANGRPGSGPRHIVFHPNGRWVYSINEIDSTIQRFLWTTTSSRTAPQGLLVNTGEVVKTIAAAFPAAKNTAAEIAVSSDGNFLYASNRGEDTLVVYSIADEGPLTFMQRVPSGGKTPRHFTLSPSGQWLLCGNQDSATVTVFRRERATGRLDGPVQTLPLDSVMFTLFA